MLATPRVLTLDNKDVEIRPVGVHDLKMIPPSIAALVVDQDPGAVGRPGGRRWMSTKESASNDFPPLPRATADGGPVCKGDLRAVGRPLKRGSRPRRSSSRSVRRAIRRVDHEQIVGRAVDRGDGEFVRRRETTPTASS